MTIHQEIKKILQTQGKSTVDENILPDLIENITYWASELLEKVTTLNTDDKIQMNRVYNRIRKDLIGETIKWLITYQNKGENVGYYMQK
jgi:hypothetical protein